MSKKVKKEYKIIKTFYVNGIEHIIVCFKGATLTMSYKEWQFIWGNMHPNHKEWGKKKYKVA